tara:strand:+ start:64922 stop:65782 length:861 start_codon:yes stop_codon:yes gene_type:complete
MKNFILVFLLSLGFYGCFDFGELKIIASLPASLEEISGIEKVPQSNLIWAVSDSHNEASLYGFNPKTKDIEKVFNLKTIKNTDWEDLAADENGRIFIGDFGNNSNKRKDLAIYTIDSFLDDQVPVSVEKTTYTYEDQSEFPPKKRKRNFDVEAFIYHQNNFYLFTRNRSSHFNGTVKLYKVPAVPGKQSATLISTYQTCDSRSICQITAATINFETGTVALLGKENVWLLTDYEGDDFFSGTIEKLSLRHHSQKESICFKNNETLYIADEQNGVEGGNLYEFTLNK